MFWNGLRRQEDERVIMKRLIRTIVLLVLALLLIPFALEIPIRYILNLAGAPLEYSYEISLALTVIGICLILDRKRIRARRQRRRERRAERRERERLRNSYVLNLSPYEYEEYVAEELRQEGYTDVDTTPKSRDFGADVLARDGDRTVCVQCKRYAPGHLVGVKAVQEIYSAKDYYGCDDAYLYTTSDYTKAAVEMANELGVLLVRTQV